MRRYAIALLALVLVGCGGGGGEGVVLRVVDQNVLHGLLDEDPEAQPFDRFPERLELIVDALVAAEPDVVLLQEVALAGEGYPDVRAELASALGDEYTMVFGDLAGRPIGEGTLGQLTLSRWPVVSSENRSVGALRSALRVTVETDAGPLAIYNVHLEGTSAGDETALVEAEGLLAFIGATADGAPVLLAGDFNAVPGDASIRAVLDAGFVDTLATAGAARCEARGDAGCSVTTRPLGDNVERHVSRRIDYIFVLPGDAAAVGVARAATFLDEPAPLADGGLLWASDHIGMQALIEIGAR